MLIIAFHLNLTVICETNSDCRSLNLGHSCSSAHDTDHEGGHGAEGDDSDEDGDHHEEEDHSEEGEEEEHHEEEEEHHEEDEEEEHQDDDDEGEGEVEYHHSDEAHKRYLCFVIYISLLM